MSAPVPCVPNSAVPQSVNIPGSPGAAGAEGSPAYSTITAPLTIPAVGATVLASIADTGFMVVGQVVIIGQGPTAITNPGPATFKVAQIVSDTVASLQYLGFFGDQATGYIISSGALVSAGGGFGVLNAVTATNPNNPTGTTSTTLVMMGLAGSIKPQLTGRVLLAITGVAMNGTATDGINIQLSYGTGAAPANGDAVTGTQVGALKHIVAPTGPGKNGFAVMSVVTGLTPGTSYWIDLAVEANTGGTATVYDIDIVAAEL